MFTRVQFGSVGSRRPARRAGRCRCSCAGPSPRAGQAPRCGAGLPAERVYPRTAEADSPTYWRARLEHPRPYGATEPADLYAGAHVGSSPQLWGGSPTRHRVMVIVSSSRARGADGPAPARMRGDRGKFPHLRGDSVPSRRSEQPFGLRLSSRLDCGGRCPVSVGAGRLCLAELVAVRR